MDRQQKLVIRAALNSAYMKETAENLVKGYSNLDANPIETKLGQALKGALEILDFDLMEEENDLESEQRSSDDSNESDHGGSTDSGDAASDDSKQ